MVVAFCLMAALFKMMPTIGTLPYDPWADVSGPTQGVPDGTINMRDIQWEILHFNTFGNPGIRSRLEYDSGWINITGEIWTYYNMTHNLDLNPENLAIDVRARADGWNTTLGGTDSDGAYSITRTKDGGYAATGWTRSFGAGDSDAWLIKMDEKGEVQWSNTYGGSNYDGALSVVQTSDGGYALAGWTRSLGAGADDFWLVKTYANGTIQWEKAYGGTDYDAACSVIQANDGGYAMAGYTGPWGGNYDYWLVKTDSDGNMQWNRTYDTGQKNRATSLLQTPDNGYAMVGYTESSLGSKFLLVKTDQDGNAQWNKTYGQENRGQQANSMVQTADGGYAIAGDGSDGFFLVRTDVDGTMIWNRTYGSNISHAQSIVRTDDGGFAVGGFIPYGFGGHSGFGGNDFLLIKMDSNGNMQWSNVYGGSGNDLAYSMIPTEDGGYVLAGFTDSFGSGIWDVWIVKTDVECGLKWSNLGPNSITIQRVASETYWNCMRVRMWRIS